MDRVLVIESDRFPVRPGEEDELVNPGTWGRALSEYIQERLPARGYEVPRFVAEDWGWWVEVRRGGDTDGVLVYADPEDAAHRRYALTGAARPGRRWRWSRFRFEDRTAWCARLADDLEALFRDDPEVEVLGWRDGFPW